MFLFTLQERYLLAKIRASRSFEADDSRPRTQHRRLAIWRTDKAVKLLSGRMSETDKRAARMGEQRRGKKRSVSMASGLPAMMYGFGDDPTPNSETVELMEVLVLIAEAKYLGAMPQEGEASLLSDGFGLRSTFAYSIEKLFDRTKTHYILFAVVSLFIVWSMDDPW